MRKTSLLLAALAAGVVAFAFGQKKSPKKAATSAKAPAYNITENQPW